MNFSAPAKPRLDTPLWNRDLILQQVRRFRTESTEHYFDVFDCADNGQFYVASLDRGASHGSWVFTVVYP